MLKNYRKCKMKRSGPEKLETDEIFPLNDLLDELLQEVFSFLDIGTLAAVRQTSKRFSTITNNNMIWQKVVDSYFSYLKALFPKRYENDAKNLIIEEISLLREVFEDIPIKCLLGAVRGKSVESLSDFFVDKICPPATRTRLLALQISLGFFHVLELEEDQDFKNRLAEGAIAYASVLGNTKVVDKLNQNFPLSQQLLESVYLMSLTQGGARISDHIYNKYLHDKISENDLVSLLDKVIFNTAINYNQYSENEIISLLKHILQFQDDEGSLKFEVAQLMCKAIDKGHINVVKYLLFYKNIKEEWLLSRNNTHRRTFFTSATFTNNMEMFRCLYEAYSNTFLIDQNDRDALEEFLSLLILQSVTNESPSSELCEFLSKIETDEMILAPQQTFIQRLVYAIHTGKLSFIKVILEQLDSRNIPLPSDIVYLRREMDIDINLSCIELVFNFIKDPIIFYKSYHNFLIQLVNTPRYNSIDFIAKLKDINGQAFTMNPRTMVPLLIMLPIEAIAENQHIADFAKSLSDESFSEVKVALKLNQREDISNILKNLRMQMDLEMPQQPLLFSAPDREDGEPASKKRRVLQQ